MFEIVRFFSPIEDTRRGIISYLISLNNADFPKFRINDHFQGSTQIDPFKIYDPYSDVLIFATYLGVHPFLQVDFEPYRIVPSFYSLKVIKDYTPPVEWELQVSNDEFGEWSVISSPELRSDFCINNTGSYPHQCANTVTNLYSCINANNSFRFARFVIHRDRRHYYSNSSNHMMRLSGFDIYGVLRGYVKCFHSSTKITFPFHFFQNAFLIFIIVCSFSK